MEDEEEIYSDDPEEQLRIENELLKLKMQAQYGAFFGGDRDLPPEVEKEFLKQVLAFQENNESAPLIKLHDVIGNPELRLSSELSAKELPRAWEDLENILNESGLVVTFEGEYPISVKYDFVINELLPLEIQQPAEGHKWIFPYEEFHPNHALDIERMVEGLMEDFFGNKITLDSHYLSNPITTEEGLLYSSEELIEKVGRFHDLFNGISDYSYELIETSIDEPDADDGPLTGYVNGEVRYNVTMADDSTHEITGPFKCYFHNKNGYWIMHYFMIHGFSWT